MLQCTSWQKLYSRPLDQLPIADRPTHCLPLPVLLSVRPSSLGGRVVDMLVQIGGNLHPIWRQCVVPHPNHRIDELLPRRWMP